MKEKSPRSESMSKEEYFRLAEDLAMSRDPFPFPGILHGVYSKIKEIERLNGGTSAYIDDLLERFTSQGMKVVVVKSEWSPKVYVVPFRSNDAEQDNLLPQQLNGAHSTDRRVGRLIAASGREFSA